MTDYSTRSRKEIEESMPLMFEAIHSELTPDFTAEDWMKLWKRAESGDTTSRQMLCELWKQKVDPYIAEEFKLSSWKNY